MSKEEILIEKLEELDYKNNNSYIPEIYKKRDSKDTCDLIIEMEIDEEYKELHLIHTAYVQHDLIIYEQRIINEIQRAFDELQDDLKYLEEFR